MIKFTAVGRLAGEPDIRHNTDTGVARYTLASKRSFHREGKPDADFIRCVAFGKNADFVEKFLHKGMKIAVSGRVETDSYDDKDGKKVYTTDFIVEEHEFCESKSSQPSADGFMPIPDKLNEEEFPFA